MTDNPGESSHENFRAAHAECILDLDAKLGTYEIDQFVEQLGLAASFLDEIPDADPIRTTRSMIAAAGSAARNMSKRHKGNSDAHAAAVQLHGTLYAIVTKIKPLTSVTVANIDLIAVALAQDFPSSEDTENFDGLLDAQEDARVAVQDAVEALRTAASKARKLLKDFPLPPAPNEGRANILAQNFVYMFATIAWPAISSNRKFPRSKTGPVVRLMEAAWRDLNLGELHDPATTLGRLAEKLPRPNT